MYIGLLLSADAPQGMFCHAHQGILLLSIRVFVCSGYNAKLTLKQCAALKRHRVLPVNRDVINDVANRSSTVHISLNLIGEFGTGFALISGDKG